MKTRFKNSDLYFLQDERLTLAAKGLLMYLIINPEERYVSYDHWVLDSHNTCEEIEQMMAELIEADYIQVENDKIKMIFMTYA